MGPSRRIGLTGGIATGKSSVARCLTEQHGVPVLDADRFAREALAPGTEATRAVLRRYGPTLQATGASVSVDRAALARIVFGDAAERQWLEQLVHPLVRARLSGALASLGAAAVVVLMIPLLFEAGLDSLCNEIWVVDCGSEAEQIRRLMARDGIRLDEARARLKAQWPMAAKLSRADVILNNSGSAELLAQQVAAALARPKANALNDDAPPTAGPAVLVAPPTV
ncbi:MAG: dephospho-CoA kinase [Cyanobacteriota bacterium]|jgi:dephospho-CoA kinase